MLDTSQQVNDLIQQIQKLEVTINQLTNNTAFPVNFCVLDAVRAQRKQLETLKRCRQAYQYELTALQKRC